MTVYKDKIEEHQNKKFVELEDVSKGEEQEAQDNEMLEQN